MIENSSITYKNNYVSLFNIIDLIFENYVTDLMNRVLRMNKSVRSEQIKRTIIIVTTISIVVKKKVIIIIKNWRKKKVKKRKSDANVKSVSAYRDSILEWHSHVRKEELCWLRKSRLFPLCFKRSLWNDMAIMPLVEIVFKSVVWRFEALCRS